MKNVSDWFNGRGERIWTSGPCLPKAVLYQAELHPDCIPTNFRSLGFPIVTLAWLYFTFYCATSVPALFLKGAKTTYVKPYFMQLWELMDAERKINRKELESIEKLEDLL